MWPLSQGKQSCRYSWNLTFRDLPVVAETPAQRDGDRREVGHVVAVAVHAAVPSGADRLWGQTGAVELRVWDVPPGCTAVTTQGEEVLVIRALIDLFI